MHHQLALSAAPQLRAQIFQNLSFLKAPSGVAFHERAPDALDPESLPAVSHQVMPAPHCRPKGSQNPGLLLSWLDQGFRYRPLLPHCMPFRRGRGSSYIIWPKA